MTPDPARWEFDVATAPHDDVKRGVLVRHWSRVVISREAFPRWEVAAQVAAGMAVSRWGGMPTSVLPRY